MKCELGFWESSERVEERSRYQQGRSPGTKLGNRRFVDNVKCLLGVDTLRAYKDELLINKDYEGDTQEPYRLCD